MYEDLDRETMMSNFKEKIAKSYILEQVAEHRVYELYKMIAEAAKNRYNEDNQPTLDSFLTECFEGSLKENFLPTREQIIQQIAEFATINQTTCHIAVVLPGYDEHEEFRNALKSKLEEVPGWLGSMWEVSKNHIKFKFCNVRFLTCQAQMRGIRIDKIYYASRLSESQLAEVFCNLRPCVSGNDCMIEFR